MSTILAETDMEFRMAAMTSEKIWNLRSKLARTRVSRCQRKYLTAWHRLKIDWQQFASFVRPSSKPAVRSAIKSSRSSIFLPFARNRGPLKASFTSLVRFFTIASLALLFDTSVKKGRRAVCFESDSDKCVSEGTVGEVFEMSVTAGLPGSSKQPDNYGEPWIYFVWLLRQEDRWWDSPLWIFLSK